VSGRAARSADADRPASLSGRAPKARLREAALAASIAIATRLCGLLSIDRAVALGAGIGQLWLGARGPRTRRVREQLALALPQSTAAQRARWTREVFVHLGRGLAELLIMRGPHREALVKRVSIEGLEHLRSAQRASPSGGVMIVTAHYGNWELAGARLAAEGVPISVVYRPRRARALDRALLGLRAAPRPGGAAAPDVEQIAMGPRAGLQVARALGAGRAVLVLLDQNARREEGVFVSFFSRPACTRAAPLAIAVRRGVPIVTAFSRRDPDGRSHRIRIDPALQLETGRSDDGEVLRRNVQRVTAAIEQEIRASPGQWIWTHRRWRSQPSDCEESPTA